MNETMSAYDEAADPHFAFGENWAAFLRKLDDRRIAEARASLTALTGYPSFEGKSFLDIGCGSGLFSLAARFLGARVHSFDYDPQSVECACSLRDRFFPNDADWRIEQGSVLDRAFVAKLGRFDIVYSWGVLHHTGAMLEAIHNAATVVAPGGIFVFALYRRTTLCGFWQREKKCYASASEPWQRIARFLFKALMRANFAYSGKSFKQYVDNYASMRGMDFERDMHDWLGGYPYESISPLEVEKLMAELKLDHVRSNVAPKSLGLFSSGCDEFVYCRPA
jgi:2-polyprenyl-3-methyl-5-hydroxy-6-metoxy-1,4-benzoquinol methylase